MAATGKSKTCVWRWQERFMHEGVDGLLRDKSRPPGKAPVPPKRVAEIVRLTQESPPHEATHATARAMAKAVGFADSGLPPRNTSFPRPQIDYKQRMENSNAAWRHSNVGRVLNNSVRRFEERVLQILEEAGNAPTRLSHISLTRNLDVEGTRITELARRAVMTKQAMAQLVTQCEDLGIVTREPDPSDGRARIIKFTPKGLKWLEDFRRALAQAEQEMRSELGWLRVDGLIDALKSYGSSADPLS